MEFFKLKIFKKWIVVFGKDIFILIVLYEYVIFFGIGLGFCFFLII